MPRQRIARFIVSFPLPQGAYVADAQEYVLDAVATMKGSLNPGTSDANYLDANPMFDLDGDSVEVKRYHKPRRT